MTKKIIDDIQSGISQLLNSVPAKDMEKNIRATLTQALANLDMVTKEELELQNRTIESLQNRIASLEKRLALLESQITK